MLNQMFGCEDFQLAPGACVWFVGADEMRITVAGLFEGEKLLVAAKDGWILSGMGHLS